MTFDIETIPLHQVLSHLNHHLKVLDLVPCEGEWSAFAGHAEMFLNDYRWLDVTVVRGGSEGYYLHLTLVPRRHDRDPSILMAVAKGYDRPKMWKIAEATAKFLDT